MASFDPEVKILLDQTLELIENGDSIEIKSSSLDAQSIRHTIRVKGSLDGGKVKWSFQKNDIDWPIFRIQGCKLVRVLKGSFECYKGLNYTGEKAIVKEGQRLPWPGSMRSFKRVF